MKKDRRSEESECAKLANLVFYNSINNGAYINGAPHIKHACLRKMYVNLVREVLERTKRSVQTPAILDLGAGEGSVTIPFLDLGAKVTAVDMSENQLEGLRTKCSMAHIASGMLELKCDDANHFLENCRSEFDITVFNSFLHHVPDYISMIQSSMKSIRAGGYFFSFQDPMRYDTLSIPSRIMSEIGYALWRVFQEDLWGGVKRRIRRSRKIYLETEPLDNAEYHVTRNGVDQDAIARLFLENGWSCKVIAYFSTQDRIIQECGFRLGLKNTFGILAQKPATN